MARRYKHKYNKRRTYKKKKKYALARTLAPKMRPFRLRYVENITMNPGAVGAQAIQYFSANGMYDPYFTGVGHQPLGFDQYMTMYDHFVVTQSKCTAYMHNQETSDTVVLGIFLNDDTNTLAVSTAQQNEQPNTKWRYLSPTGSGGDAGTVTKTFNARKDLGRKSPLSDPQLKGSTSSNPSEQMYYSIYIGPISSVDSIAQELQVVIEYTGWLIEPKDLVQS